MSRYKLSLLGDELVWQRENDGPLPIRSLGFLRYSQKETPNAELVLEARNGEILLWIENRKELLPRKPRGAA